MIIAGTRFGHYEILAPIGAGGMGEVYRARDSRLGRDVAIKVLPADFAQDADRLRRFEQEARAAGRLNHPNILIVHDIGTHDGAPYIVAELLEGETLRERIEQGALPLRKVTDFALQMARGLAAAHDKQIIHRDLKPENVFVTRDGRVKILDFGLAKSQPMNIEAVGDAPTAATQPGVVMGTVGYMSPEQVRGQDADPRSDIFSFGTILYEMLSGRRAFRRETAAETMTAILKEDPPPLAETNRDAGPGLERVVRHCLEKKPEERFQSASDLGFAIESLSGLLGASQPQTAIAEAPVRRRVWPKLAGISIAFLIAGAAAGVLLSGKVWKEALPAYQRLTFNRGTVWNARFAPDGQNILYSAKWGGRPLDVFAARVGMTESRSLKLDDSDVLAVSASNEMAILRNRQRLGWYLSRGTLARMSIDGGAARDILENVQEADWSPDGRGLAVVRWVDGQNQLEYPAGHVLYKTSGYISHPRISPKGDLVAFMDHQIQWDNRGWVAVVDGTGKKTVLSGEWQGEEGLAWSPSGSEIWFTATKPGQIDSLYAVTLSGRERPVLRMTSKLILHDIARDGRVLLTSFDDLITVVGRSSANGSESDISLLHIGQPTDLSADGKTVLFGYQGEGSGINYAVYLHNMDSPSSVRLGDGALPRLSPDGKWAVSILSTPSQLQLVPTGAGESRPLDRGPIQQYGTAGWFSDAKRIAFQGREAGHGWRYYVQSIEGGPPRPVTGESTILARRGIFVSPDGRFLIGSDGDRQVSLYPVDGGSPQPLAHLDNDDVIIGWGSDGRTLYLSRLKEVPIRVYRFDPATGSRQLLKEIMPADPAGIWPSSSTVLMTPDGKGYVYSVRRILSDLYVVDGLK
jgi:Tol biopolymer transport system component